MIQVHSFDNNDALFLLTIFVLGLTLARLALGFILNSKNTNYVYYSSVGIAAIGATLLMTGYSTPILILGIVLLGIGLAAGFPIILGKVGDLYSRLSGTAFSIVLVLALIGNTLINYLMGIIAEEFGVHYFSHIIFISIILMSILIFLAQIKVSEKNNK